MSKRKTSSVETLKTLQLLRAPQPKRISHREPAPLRASAPQVTHVGARVNGARLPPASILALQRTVGNSRVQRMLAKRINNANNEQKGEAAKEPVQGKTPESGQIQQEALPKEGEGKSPGNHESTARESIHLVQRRGMVQAQGTDPAPPQGQNAGTGSTTSGLQRVQDAIAANNLQALITIQHELRRQMLTDPLNPPADARVGLATARHWTMDRVAAIRDTYAPRITAASTGASTGTDATAAVETLETSMDTECAPYLNVLMEGDPQYRYEHFDTTVSEKVFAAVRLHSARRGVGQIGHRTAAEAESRAHANLPTGAWCGAFAYTQAEQGGGFDPHWASSMQGESGIRAMLETYGGVMAHTWIWVFDHWEPIRQYHARRNSLRWYERIRRAPPSRGIQPGDLVLIDNNYGVDPDHITTAIAFDGRFLTTVGGNQGAGEAGVSRSGHAFDLQHNPDPNDVRKTDASGHRIPQTVDPSLGPKNVRVHGIGRWSVVDYERHLYRTSTQMPTAPPSAAELAALG